MTRSSPTDGRRSPAGFTLIETLTVLTITAMIMIATMSVYSTVRRNVAAIDGNLDQGELPREILQRIEHTLGYAQTRGAEFVTLSELADRWRGDRPDAA